MPPNGLLIGVIAILYPYNRFSVSRDGNENYSRQSLNLYYYIVFMLVMID